MSQYKIDAEVVLRLACGRWDEILSNLAPSLKQAIDRAPRHCECPIHGGSDGFRFFRDFKHTGQCICNTCGAFDGLHILMKVNGWNFFTALKAVSEFLNAPEGIEPTSHIETIDGKVLFIGISTLRSGNQCFCVKLRSDNGQTRSCWGRDLQRACSVAGLKVGDNARISRLGTKNISYKGKEYRKVLWSAQKTASDAELALQARKVEEESSRREVSIVSKWEKAAIVNLTCPQQTPLLTYLKNRGICPSSSDILHNCRFIADEPYFDQQRKLVGRFPCMICAVRDTTGELVTLHRTYLTPTGQKIGFGPAKKLLPVPAGRTINGAAISFGTLAKDGILCLAEGIETALSVQKATGYPCMACVSAQGLVNTKLPTGTKVVFIFADNDFSETGQRAAERLRGRLLSEGIPSVIFLPGKDVLTISAKGTDWNDVLRQYGEKGFPFHRASSV